MSASNDEYKLVVNLFNVYLFITAFYETLSVYYIFSDGRLIPFNRYVCTYTIKK
jgi:hypothetical protein